MTQTPHLAAILLQRRVKTGNPPLNILIAFKGLDTVLWVVGLAVADVVNTPLPDQVLCGRHMLGQPEACVYVPLSVICEPLCTQLIMTSNATGGV